MKYEVIVLNSAVSRLDDNYEWWKKNRSAEQAARWFNGFAEEIVGLEDNPQRLAIAPENSEFPFTVRELHFGLGTHPTHRALFTIRHQQVVVFSIRHVSQRPATLDDY
jgi:plasmid stabilization system protein ParE